MFFFLSSSNLFAEDNWKYIKNDEFCYIQSSPISTEIPKGKSRGNHGLVVYRIHKSPDLFIQITAGYNYKSSESVKVKIDENTYDFFSDASDTAWAKDDKKVIYAMKKGLSFITTGFSSK